MEYRNQVMKALQDLSAWGEDHWLDTDIFSDAAGSRYRAFIEKVDKDFDHLCNRILFELADAIVGHRQIMMDSGKDYFGDYVCALDERPLLAELDKPERFNHGSGNTDLPNPEYLQETMSELFEWAAAKLEEMTTVQNIDNYNRFMADLDVSFEALLKWHEIYDLDAMVPLLNKPAEKRRPFLENVDEMFDYNGPETWVVTLDLSRCHAAPERLQ